MPLFVTKRNDCKTLREWESKCKFGGSLFESAPRADFGFWIAFHRYPKQHHKEIETKIEHHKKVIVNLNNLNSNVKLKKGNEKKRRVLQRGGTGVKVRNKMN